MSVNKVILLGRLGGDPELKYTQSGQGVCNFTLATSEKWTDKNGQKQEKTEWSRIVVWGKLGELCNQYLQKGRQAFVEGKMVTRSWEDEQTKQKRYATDVVAHSVQFIGDAPQGQQANQGQQQNMQAQGQPNQGQAAPQGGQTPPPQSGPEGNFTADDIPF